MEDNRVGVWSIGLSTCGKTIDEELFKEYQQVFPIIWILLLC